MQQPTTPTGEREQRAKMTIRIYTVSSAGVASETRATVSVPYGPEPLPPIGSNGYPACACPQHRKAEAVR